MAYNPTTWIDGTTPVDASHLNALEGGVADNAAAIDELNSKNFVTTTNNSTVTVTTSNITAGSSRDYAYTIGCLVFVAVSSSCYAVYLSTLSNLFTIASAGNYLSASAANSTLTVTNSNTGNTARGIAFCW